MATAVDATLLGNADDAGEAAYDDAHADTVVDALDAGAAAGYVEVRKGAAPGVGSAATGTLIVEIEAGDPAFGDSSGGTATANGTPQGTAVAAEADVDSNGAWFRAYDSDDNTVMQGDVAFTDGGEEMILDSNEIAIGDTVSITSWTYTTTATTS